MSKTKANFIVDDAFPLIDGAGHSDKIDFFNVKGGGSTNTTNFDSSSYDCHWCITSRSPVVVGTDLSSSLYDPDLSNDDAGIWHANNPGCLNAIYPGDSTVGRGSDRVCLSRLEISGTVSRSAGYYSSISNSGLSAFPYNRPKCFLAVVLDTQADRAIPPICSLSQDSLGPFTCGNAVPATAVNRLCGVPMLALRNSKRYRVLCFDIIDFDEEPSFAFTPKVTAGTSTDVPWTMDVEDYRSHWSWPSSVRGFRFDVDLADVLCSFNGTNVADIDISTVVDNALHFYALCFDGVSLDSYALDAFQTLTLSYFSRVSFYDWLIPKIPHAPAGADGPVVPPAEDDLDVLADESAKLAGDGPSASKKLRKGDVGAYNFMPRDDDVLMQFPDDPEVARLSVPGTRGSSKGPSRKKFRRYGSYRPKFPFGSFDPYEPGAGERDYKRGKF